jgi:hypothetical protein
MDSLTFTSGPVTGKKMIVQVTTTGNDLGNDQFNIAIPGGGEGSTQGCTKQYGRDDVWGADYGGVSHRDDCDALPAPLQAGCYWRFDWFRNADNPDVSWEKVTCPEQLSYTSNCRRNDDPLPGQSTPTPTPTTTAPISSGTVQPGGQCGGKTYRGPTRCVGGTVCTFVDENSYFCKTSPVPMIRHVCAKYAISNRPCRSRKHKNHSNNNNHTISSANHRITVGPMWRPVLDWAYSMPRLSVCESRSMLEFSLPLLYGPII